MSFCISCSKCGEELDIYCILREIWLTESDRYVMYCEDCGNPIFLDKYLNRNELENMWKINEEIQDLSNAIESAHEGA